MRDFALPQQVPERPIDCRVLQGERAPAEQEQRIRRVWYQLQAFADVLLECSAGGSAQGYPTGFAELAFSNVEPFFARVKVHQIQSERFTDPDARAVQQPKECVIDVGSKGVRWRQF